MRRHREPPEGDVPEILLRGSAADVLTLRFPRADDDWLTTEGSVELGWLNARFAGALLIGELVAFRAALEQLYKGLYGTACLAAIEAFLTLTVEGDGHGHIIWTVQVWYPVGMESRLSFVLEQDQTFLPSVLRDFDDVIAVYNPSLATVAG
jgi:hypothetical protein